MTRAELIDAYAEWLSKFHWAWFGTLTFRGYPSPSKARRVFRTWITEIEESEGTKEFRWVCVTEKGAFGDNIHFHVLVGGLRIGSKYEWLLRWQELAGDALISYFWLHREGIRYLLKTAVPGQDFDIELHFPSKKSKQKQAARGRTCKKSSC